jgi:hypothetical protein
MGDECMVEELVGRFSGVGVDSMLISSEKICQFQAAAVTTLG